MNAKQLASRMMETGYDPRTMAEMRRDIKEVSPNTIITDQLCMEVDDEMANICEMYNMKPYGLLSDRPDGKKAA